MPDPEKGKNALIPFAIFLVILVTIVFIPPLGLLISVIAPVPLILVNLHQGNRIGLVTVALVFLVLLVLMGPKQAMLFFSEYAVMALIMAETIRARMPIGKIIFSSAIISAVLSTFFLISILAEKGLTPAEFFQEQVRESVQQTIETLKSRGENPADLESAQEIVEAASKKFAGAYPAFIIIGSFLAAIVNFLLTRWLWARFYSDYYFESIQVSEWVLPDYWIWPLIISGAILFFADGQALIAGLNIFLVVVLFYFFQGLAVVLHLLQKKSVPVFFWILAFVFIFTQPVLIGGVVGMGVFDMWVDFRKLRIRPQEGQDGNDE